MSWVGELRRDMREMRIARGDSQSSLAEKLSCTQQALSRFESKGIVFRGESFKRLVEEIESYRSHTPISGHAARLDSECPHCDLQIPGPRSGMAFCGKCGMRIGLTCSKCGMAWDMSHNFCGKCANPLVVGYTFTELDEHMMSESSTGVFVLDSQFKVAYVNKAIERFFGIARTSMLGKDKRTLIEERIHHVFEDPDTFMEKVLRTYRDNTYVENFVCKIKADDRRRARVLEH